MTYLNGWQVEDLAHAVLDDLDATHVEKASPRRTRHHDGTTSQDRPAFDFFECFDLLAIFPEGLRAVQATRNTSLVSEKMVDIVEKGPWPSWMTAEVWVWGDGEFTWHELVYEAEGVTWKRVQSWPIVDPERTLNRFDTSLDEVTP